MDGEDRDICLGRLVQSSIQFYCSAGVEFTIEACWCGMQETYNEHAGNNPLGSLEQEQERSALLVFQISLGLLLHYL